MASQMADPNQAHALNGGYSLLGSPPQVPQQQQQMYYAQDIPGSRSPGDDQQYQQQQHYIQQQQQALEGHPGGPDMESSGIVSHPV